MSAVNSDKRMPEDEEFMGKFSYSIEMHMRKGLKPLPLLKKGVEAKSLTCKQSESEVCRMRPNISNCL
jgi:hypothetical protein